MRTEARTQNPEPRTRKRGLPAGRTGYFILGATALAYYALLNALYFARNGWPSAPGPDIWYLLAVAQGLQPLSPLDATFWLVKGFGGLSPKAGLVALNVLSVLLHAGSAVLVYHYLGKLLRLETPVRLLAALLFAALPQNVLGSTAFLTHFSVAQPFLVIAAGRLLPWTLGRPGNPLPDTWGLLALAESMIIGPEGWMLLGALATVAIARSTRGAELLAKTHCPGWLAVILAAGAFALAYPLFWHVLAWLAFHWRGIDLSWQRDILTADLLGVHDPLAAFFGFHLVWLALAGFAIWRRHYLATLLILVFVVLAIRLGRGYYGLELAGFAALAAVLFRDSLLRPYRAAILSVLIAWLAIHGLFGAKACYTRPHMARAADAIRKAARAGDLIACSPSYGFFFQAWTRLSTTDDLHHPPGGWAELASMRPLEAGGVMKDRGVDFIVFNSWDYREAGGAMWFSGGLQQAMAQIPDEDVRLSLVVRAMDREPPLVKPMKVVAAEKDARSGEKAIVLSP
jgi:hypothetical protein